MHLSAKYLIKGYFNGLSISLHFSAVYLYLLGGDAVVGVGDEGPAGDGAGLPDLGADEEADGAEELQLHLGDAAAAEKAVHDVHGEGEHLGLRVLLVHHLQHPLCHDAPHVGRDSACRLRKKMEFHTQYGLYGMGYKGQYQILGKLCSVSLFV